MMYVCSPLSRHTRFHAIHTGQLSQENEKLKSTLLKMEIRLARANSLIDIENNGEVSMVTGWPDAIMERVSLYTSQSALY